MRTIGTPYVASSKTNYALLIPSLVFLGVPVALLLGYFYSVVTQFNPFSILNLPILVLAIVLLTALIYIVQNKSQSRSLVMNILIAAVLCVATYYSQWSHFISALQQQSYWATLSHPADTLHRMVDWAINGKMPLLKFKDDGVAISGILLSVSYLLELFLFLFPIAITHLPNVFCESCQRYNYSFKFYVDAQQKGIEKLLNAPAGQFSALSTLTIVPSAKTLLEAVPKSVQELGVLELIYCKCMTCQDNGYLTINRLQYQRRAKTGQFNVKKIDRLFSHLTIDERTRDVLDSHINQTRASGHAQA